LALRLDAEKLFAVGHCTYSGIARPNIIQTAGTKYDIEYNTLLQLQVVDTYVCNKSSSEMKG
jgi:hypothetical protein